MAAPARKRVFILGGGASLGAHQVGALKRLVESGITPDAIVGSSIGVINACLYASGGVENMERAWMDFPSVATKFRPSLKDNPLAGLSLFSMEPFAESLEAYMDFDRLFTSPIELSFILLNLSRGEGQFFSNRHADSADELRTLSRAGYAIPVLFPPVRHHDEMYADGGFAWNVPLAQAIEMGATEIFVLAVVSTALPFRRSFRSLPDFLGRVTDVLWRTIGNAGFVTTRIEDDGTYCGVPVTVIHPTEELAGFKPMSLLSTNSERSRRLINAGYRDASREIARLERARKSQSPPRVAQPEVEPAFRHEVA